MTVLLASMCTTFVPGVLEGQGESSPGTRIMDGSEPSRGCWELNVIMSLEEPGKMTQW